MPSDAAGAWGYADPAFFRRLFKRTTGISPGAYRIRTQVERGLSFTPLHPVEALLAAHQHAMKGEAAIAHGGHERDADAAAEQARELEEAGAAYRRRAGL